MKICLGSISTIGFFFYKSNSFKIITDGACNTCKIDNLWNFNEFCFFGITTGKSTIRPTLHIFFLVEVKQNISCVSVVSLSQIKAGNYILTFSLLCNKHVTKKKISNYYRIFPSISVSSNIGAIPKGKQTDGRNSFF